MPKKPAQLFSDIDPLEAARIEAGVNWDEELEIVVKAAITVSKEPINGTALVKKYLKARNNRPSKRVANKSKTVPDEVFETILNQIFPEDDAKVIIKQHSVMMSLENLMGDLLEEYLSIKLADDGWYCCWGSSVQATDFCSKDGRLLQIKSSDNTENSSSSKVRTGTIIEKWFRRFANKGTYNWDELKKFAPKAEVSEEDFRIFVLDTFTNNPYCFFKE